MLGRRRRSARAAHRSVQPGARLSQLRFESGGRNRRGGDRGPRVEAAHHVGGGEDDRGRGRDHRQAESNRVDERVMGEISIDGQRAGGQSRPPVIGLLYWGLSRDGKLGIESLSHGTQSEAAGFWSTICSSASMTSSANARPLRMFVPIDAVL